jgi:bifunctional UDP-N-acetylglucosamine pyrophosphorylase/glucosamine-1-phosphate N-acetyltransferase
MDTSLQNTWVVILAAGRGTRMNSQTTNKVAMEIGGVPMLSKTVQNLRSAGIHNICIVVGHAKESVTQLFDDSVLFAEQTEQLGTGHAAKVGVDAVPTNTQNVLILYGDDSYVYTPEIYTNLLQTHKDTHADVSFITLTVENPTGLGRILRDSNKKVVGIVEEKDATEEQKLITEINPACYIFSYSFFNENIPLVPKSEVTGEYYLTALVEIAVEKNANIQTVNATGIKWRGINTPAELQEANEMVDGK